MSVKNFYPTKPVIPFAKKAIEMGVIIDAIRSVDYPVEVKRAAYYIVRNETANGSSAPPPPPPPPPHSHTAPWPEKWTSKISATMVKNENMTGRLRGFLVFDTLKSGIEFLCDRVQAKGIFVGEQVNGRYHKGDVAKPEQLADAYQDEWVHGQDHKTTATEVANFMSMYNKAKIIFP